MEKNHTFNKGKKTKIILIIVSILIIIILLSGYLLIHSFIGKINIVKSTDNPIKCNAVSVEDNIPEKEIESEETEYSTEEIDPELPEASEEDIKALEEELYKDLVENSTPVLRDKDVFNILLIGSDTRKEGGTGRSDSMILVSLNDKKNSITVTSLLRDIYLPIPGKKNNRINAAYAFGGAELLMDTVEQNFRIEVDQYASVDFYTFIKVVDAVGGVTIDVKAEEIPCMNTYITEINEFIDKDKGLDCLKDDGAQLLNGKQALAYARIRKVGNSDFDRTKRQRLVLEQIFNKVKTMKLIEITELLDVVLPEITTNLSEGEIFSLLLSLPSYIKYDVEQWSIPMAGTYSSLRIRGMAVLGIDFDKNINELHGKIYQEE